MKWQDVYKLLLVICGGIWLFYSLKSCSIPSCEDIKADYANFTYYSVVINDKSQGSDAIAYFYGGDPKTGKKITIQDGGKVPLYHWDAFHVGDTVIKNKGDATLYIWGKGRRDSISFNCTP